VIQALLSASGPRKGAASCFNEYMPSYEHDWYAATFQCSEYDVGFRKTVVVPERPMQSHHTIQDADLSF